MQWQLRRLHYLLKRVGGSMAQRGLRGTFSRVAEELRPRATDSNWTLEPLDVPFIPISLPYSESPRVSIVIPVHGKLRYTLACLRSIARYGADASFEVIVVDDVSPDESATTLAQTVGLRLLRNTENLGFIGSCNAGAAIARGAFVLFLNNDTQVTPGWLDRLLDCFTEEDGCGIAGSRLVYPDGRLQEAGGIVYADGKAWNYGRFEKRNDPRFLYRRDVDYVSGAALMIDIALFRKIGGFDTRYAPAYCEDVDLAFAVRAAGRRVVYQPASLVVHCEGISSGLDPFEGVKQYQIINQAKLAEKWQGALLNQPKPRTPVEQAIHHGGARHILIVDALTPDPSRDSGSLRLINIMRLLREQGWRISFMADNRRATEDEIELLGSKGIHVLCKPWAPTLSTWLAREGAGLDAVMLCRHYIAQPHLLLVRRLAPTAKILFDTVDLHFLREQRAAAHSGNAALTRQAEASRRREIALVRACDASFVVSPVELRLLADEVPEARVELLSNVHEVFGRTKGFAERSGLVFVGGFGHPPNVDAVRWLVEQILPCIREQRPDIVLHLIGDMPDDARQRFIGIGTEVHGRVDDLKPWMENCRVALAPLRYGAGVKGKVNMAMSYGLPVVATPIAAEGMNLIDGQNVLLGADAPTIATAVLRLYDDEALWLRLSEAGLDNVRQYFSFDAARAVLQRVLH
ncbi:glycosyltransferase [Rhodanobacter sp. OK091]|uniref:glycosyltransferase n=1 Tax=Rhodanobacter sp. OK091 TaxID=1881037 RepID=UPI00091C08A8|nr:glycosyltransferase [Rhodanobacter sp. OK091]SHM49322.1 Glycosyltransferase, GT2 family [Rhodanobacter sp. OK091]